MATAAVLQKRNGRYLWFALLGLGFQPDASIAGKANINVKHINLGPNMFDKPNKDAFYIITHFLLEKLNPARFSESYRYCWPVLNHKADAEFRKVTCAWLREIMDETANAASKVVASLFLSPGGPRFVSLMLNLANHVMLQEMKTFTTEDDWVPEAAAMPASSVDMAMKRLDLISARFLKTAVDQDRFLHEYQRRAQLLVKSSRKLRAEGAKYDELLKHHSGVSLQVGATLDDKIKKVRCLWSTIDGVLSSTEEEQQAVESVLKGDVDQYVLDGKDRILKIPRSLQERVEQLPHQLTSVNLYESGQLSLLCVLELVNHALQLLREERRRLSDAPKPDLRPAHLQEKCQQMTRALQGLHLIRQKMAREGIPDVRNSIRELEAEWDRKWMDTLKDTPLASFLNEDPAAGFLSPMAPLSFEPMTEASFSIFSQFPATLLEEKPSELKPQEAIEPRSSKPNRFSLEAAEMTESLTTTTEAALSQVNTSLDWLFDTSPSHGATAAAQVSVRKTARVPPKVFPTRTQILDLECENLADQFADAVTTSPSEVRVKGPDLESLLNTLHGDPFSTRKQLPRTPESLIEDVKSSWRKALEESKAEKHGRPVTVNDSVFGRLTPPVRDVSQDVLESPFSPKSTGPVRQQGVDSLQPVQLWDTFDSPSGTGSSAVQFSVNLETLPELPSCDSLLSLDDDAKSDDGSEKRTWEHALPDCMVPALDQDWLMEPTEASDKVFSLELDTLETPSTPKMQEYSLPKLITFSPIDDMKR